MAAVFDRVETEDAIERKLHICGRVARFLGPSWDYPVEITDTHVVMRDADCGLAKPTISITHQEWADNAARGLFKQTGFYSFTLASDPAVDDIRFCNQSPDAAGRRLHTLKQREGDMLAALKPFANFACNEPHVGEPECHNCIARTAITKAEGSA